MSTPRHVHASTALAMLAIVTAVLPGGTASAETTLHTSAVTGTAARSEALALAPPAPASPRPHGARRAPGIASSRLSAGPLAPQASSSGLSEATPSLFENFNGVSSRDSAATNFGAQFEPPDQGLCAGNGFVVEMVNSAYSVYRVNGSLAAGPLNVAGPFNLGPLEFTSDPRCYYDPATHTWFATILFINKRETGSSLEVAVNTSGDPTTPWSDYRIDTTGIGGSSGPKHPGCPCFGDQPTLGIDAANLYVTTDEFSIRGPQENGAQIYALAKRDLVSLAAKVHFVHFTNLTSEGGTTATVQPALTTAPAPAEYFLSSRDSSGTAAEQIRVWAMTNRSLVASGGKPTLSSLVVPSERYGVPPLAQQEGTSSLLESGDDRMQQVQFMSGEAWGELGTVARIPGDSRPRAAAAWFALRPALAGGVLAAAKLQRQGYVALSGSNLLYPGLQATPGGTAAMVMTLAGKTHFPSAAYASLAPGASSFGPVRVAASGSTHYDPSGERWGDYSFAVLDPGGTAVWLATEYVPPASSRTRDGVNDWGTRVLELATP